MAKRFTDTNKYKKPFIRGLQGAYKLFWDYLYHDCDHAGIWIVDMEIAQLYVGKDMPINKTDALRFFNEGEKRIVEIDHGSKWFLPSFIEFQYGELSENNRAHNSVISILKKYGLYKNNKVLVSPLQGGKDKEQDKEKDKEQELLIKESLFKEDILTYINTYPKEMLKDFFDYWSEANKSKTKMRFEMQPTWDIKKRLATWAKNDKGFKQPQKGTTQADMDQILINKRNKLLNAGN